MSWISENYEKAALGGAAVIAIGLVVLGWSGNNAARENYELDLPAKNKDANVAGLPRILEVDNSFKSPHEVVRPTVNRHEVGLFTSIPIVVQKGRLTEPMDLLSSSAIHEGIKNEFWVKYGIDPAFDNSPDLDPDGDGFTNRDEFNAETSPVDFKSHPDPVLKLSVVNVETEEVHVKPSSHKTGSTFRLENAERRRINKTPLAPIVPGNIIEFVGEKMQRRFKFIAVKGEGARSRIWVIEDLKPNKKGVTYEFDKKGNLVGSPDKVGVKDSTVEFKLNALNEGGKSFKLEENTRFKLPNKGGDETKDYFFKSINLAEKTLLVEYKTADGSTKTQEINF